MSFSKVFQLGHSSCEKT